MEVIGCLWLWTMENGEGLPLLWSQEYVAVRLESLIRSLGIHSCLGCLHEQDGCRRASETTGGDSAAALGDLQVA